MKRQPCVSSCKSESDTTSLSVSTCNSANHALHNIQSGNKNQSPVTVCTASHAQSVDAGIGSECSSDSGSWPLVSATHTDQSCVACDTEQAVNSWLQGTKSPPNKNYHRSSSLKTTHSDGSLLSQKKAVRFADALGLDLAEVKHFMEDTGLPVWYQQQQQQPFRIRSRTLKATFDTSRLRTSAYFKERLQQNKVCLESVSVNGLTVAGTVRVVNLAFEKRVFVRYTTDFWAHSTTVQATYVAMSSEQHTQTDAFAFTLVIPTDVRDYSIVELCIGYRVGGSEHWDNNGGRNYAFDVIVEDLDYLDGGY